MTGRDQKKRLKNGRGDGRENGQFMAIPHAVIKSIAWKSLTFKAKVLLIEMFLQFNGKNNGDLCAAPATMAEFGWSGNSTLPAARLELEQAGLIVLTRQGGKNKPNLYAVTWLRIDECRGAGLEHPDAHKTNVAQLGYWRHGHNPEARKRTAKIDSPLPSDGTTNPDNTATR